MARGHKTGGRQKGTPNKLNAQLSAKLAEAAAQGTPGVLSSQVAAMMPLEVMLHAMRFEAERLNWRTAAYIAEKAAPYIHAKVAPRAEDGGGDSEVTIRITGGLPDVL